jgi:GAF domain-containing protein
MVALVQGFLFLDTQLGPARRALLPADPSHQDIRISVGQLTRQYFVTSILLLMAILTIGGVGYQKFLALKTFGSNPETILFQYQTQLIVMGIAIFIVGTFLASRLAQAVSLPTKEIIRVMERVKKGDYSERAPILTSDDMAQLTIHLNQMLDQLQTTEMSMEHSVQERTAALEQRGRQLQAAAQVAREVASLQDLNIMLSRTVNLISEQFGFYHTGIFLMDDSGEYVELQAASSEGGKRMLARGHRLAVGQQGIVGAAAYQNRPRIAMDVAADRTFFNNPDLPMTHSEAAVPLTVHGKVIGVLDIQSTEQSVFETSDVDVFQILADQIALAIQNARLIAESQDAILRLEATTAEDLRRVWRERVRNVKNAYRFTSAGLTPAIQIEAQTSSSDAKSNYLNIPISLRGQRIGTIAMHRKGDSTWSESDRSLAIEVSDQVGLALENARLLEDAQRHAAQEQSLSELTASLGRSLDPDTILQTAVRELHQLPNVSEVSVYISSTQPSPSERSKTP